MRLGLKRRPRRRAERVQGVIAILGVMIVFACAAVLALESLKGRDRAELSAQVVDTVLSVGGRQLTVQVENRGGRTASEVTVTAKTSEEAVQAVIDYVPARGNRHVVIRVPSEGEVTIAIDSWIYP